MAAEHTSAAGLGRARPRVMRDADAESPSAAVQATIAPGSRVQIDGWSGYVGPKDAGYAHLPGNLPTGVDVDAWLPQSHSMVSSFKLWTLAAFQGAGPRHLQASLDEYCYRLSRRDKREDLFRRALDRCLLYTGPAPHSLLADTRANGMVMDGGQTAIASVLCDMDAAITAL